MKIYLIGSLRNPNIVSLSNSLEKATGHEIFASWFAAGPEADDYWKEYEQARGRSYRDALASYAAQNVFQFDKRNIDDSSAVVLALPAGRSGHLELGYALGSGKPGFILLSDVELKESRWDVMYNFATAVCESEEELIDKLIVFSEVDQFV